MYLFKGPQCLPLDTKSVVMGPNYTDDMDRGTISEFYCDLNVLPYKIALHCSGGSCIVKTPLTCSPHSFTKKRISNFHQFLHLTKWVSLLPILWPILWFNFSSEYWTNHSWTRLQFLDWFGFEELKLEYLV